MRTAFSAAGEILAMAEELETDLLVVGTHGRQGFERALLGSVAERVLRNSALSVLVVPQQAAREAQAGLAADTYRAAALGV